MEVLNRTRRILNTKFRPLIQSTRIIRRLSLLNSPSPPKLSPAPLIQPTQHASKKFYDACNLPPVNLQDSPGEVTPPPTGAATFTVASTNPVPHCQIHERGPPRLGIPRAPSRRRLHLEKHPLLRVAFRRTLPLRPRVQLLPTHPLTHATGR